MPVPCRQNRVPGVTFLIKVPPCTLCATTDTRNVDYAFNQEVLLLPVNIIYLGELKIDALCLQLCVYYSL